MRYCLIALLSLAVWGVLPAQVWLEAGGKFTFGPSGFTNSNMASDGQHDFSLGLSHTAGAVLGVNIGDNHGFNVEALLGTYYQDFTYRGGAEPLKQSVEWKVADYYLLYRLYTNNGMYFELGPKLTNLRNVSQTTGLSTEIPSGGAYEDQYYSAVAGLGTILAGSKVFVIQMGLRFEYGLTDMVSVTGQRDNFPAYYTSYANTAKTTAYRVSFGMSVSFALGGTAQAACGRRVFMLGGKY